MAEWDTQVLTPYVLVRPTGAHDILVETMINVSAEMDETAGDNDTEAADVRVEAERTRVTDLLNLIWGPAGWSLNGSEGTIYGIAVTTAASIPGSNVRVVRRDTGKACAIAAGTLSALLQKAPTKSGLRDMLSVSRRSTRQEKTA